MQNKTSTGVVSWFKLDCVKYVMIQLTLLYGKKSVLDYTTDRTINQALTVTDVTTKNRSNQSY